MADTNVLANLVWGHVRDIPVSLKLGEQDTTIHLIEVVDTIVPGEGKMIPATG
jgi:hypothetical protein